MENQATTLASNDAIGVFLSSKSKVPESYRTATIAFGTWLGEQGKTLVYGGSNCGLMDELAKAVKANGGRVIGVLPQVEYKNGWVSQYLDVDIPTADLADRKREMIARSRVLVALPGGVGTIDEIFTVLSMRSMGYPAPEVILYNVDGCWSTLLAMLEDFYQHGLTNKAPSKIVKTATTLAELIALLEA